MSQSVEAREVLAQHTAATTAPHLAFAVQRRDGDLVAQILQSLNLQELHALVVVLADQAPASRSRPEDGLVDEIAVERAAKGDPIPLTRVERDAAIRRMHARGVSLRQTASHFHVSYETAQQALSQPEQPKLGEGAA